MFWLSCFVYIFWKSALNKAELRHAASSLFFNLLRCSSVDLANLSSNTKSYSGGTFPVLILILPNLCRLFFSCHSWELLYPKWIIYRFLSDIKIISSKSGFGSTRCQVVYRSVNAFQMVHKSACLLWNTLCTNDFRTYLWKCWQAAVYTFQNRDHWVHI